MPAHQQVTCAAGWLSLVLAVVLLLVSDGCGRQRPSSGTASSIDTPALADVIDSRSGYIIDNAGIAPLGTVPVVAIEDSFGLVPGRGMVMIIRTVCEDESAQMLLALEMDGFVPVTDHTFRPADGRSAFWVFGTDAGMAVRRRTGQVEGVIHATEQSPSKVDLGLGRALQDAHGDITLAVTNIDAGSLKVDRVRKYASRFALPILTLDEMKKLMASPG